MKGKTIALVDPSTTAGYLSQKEYLKNNGIDIDKDLNIYWAGNHDGAINAVLLGQAEIGGAKDTIVRKFQKANRVFDSTAVIIDETPRKGVPNNTFAVRKGLDRKISAKLKKAFLGMQSDPYGKRVLATFGATRFISTSDDDYKSLYTLVTHLNLDLQTYPYRRDLQPSRIRRTGE
jgi:phosphonate transport system substrate-binding protein